MRTRSANYIAIVNQDIWPRKKKRSQCKVWLQQKNNPLKADNKIIREHKGPSANPARLVILILFMGTGMFVAGGMFFASNAVPEQNPFAALPREERLALYSDLKYAFLFNRTSMVQKYRDAGTAAEKNRILDSAGTYLLSSMTGKLIPHWYGTSWDFNGTSEIPGSGQIACGYFVTTVLRDAGFSLERIRLSQEPSETIIRELVGSAYVKRYSNMDARTFFMRMRQEGPGLYVVGLDNHIGFLLVEDKKMYFIHSSYFQRRGVVKEEAESSYALVKSGYRVVGNLLGDPGVIKKWLQNEKMGK